MPVDSRGMNEQQRSPKLAAQTRRAQGGVGAPHLHQGGPAGNSSGPRDAGDRGDDRRYGEEGRGTSKTDQRERKDEGWTSRQGGSQPGSRSGSHR